MVTVHYSLWAKCTSCDPLTCLLLVTNFVLFIYLYTFQTVLYGQWNPGSGVQKPKQVCGKIVFNVISYLDRMCRMSHKNGNDMFSYSLTTMMCFLTKE